MYIYQPKQPRDLGRQRQSSVYSSASEDNATQTGSSAYDYIDTGIKVAIICIETNNFGRIYNKLSTYDSANVVYR
ncbi:hypothetical protein DPMN_185161 [Dreissena polymorpha]|uniref:Uncharacterized protein n=1 Tax=Dreissena polymorpha TaxID=45954 RepID=A0A9D4DKJ1_DREPO|nr:hypothetical protein DPMN_185161 [Dreissena polymorpha]